MLKKDKVKVIDESLGDDSLKRFLSLLPPTDINKDFNILLRAYRGLPAYYFERFLQFFIDEGYDINAKDENGNNILAVLASHEKAQAYRQALIAKGATS